MLLLQDNPAIPKGQNFTDVTNELIRVPNSAFRWKKSLVATCSLRRFGPVRILLASSDPNPPKTWHWPKKSKSIFFTCQYFILAYHIPWHGNYYYEYIHCRKKVFRFLFLSQIRLVWRHPADPNPPIGCQPFRYFHGKIPAPRINHECETARKLAWKTGSHIYEVVFNRYYVIFVLKW